MPGYLKVRRPSPTTASFTVSNASQCTSTPAKALFHLQFLLRAFIFVTVLAVCAARLRSSFFAEDGSWVRWTAVWASPFGELACRIADSYSPLVVTVVSVVAMYGVFRKGYTEESLLVIRGLGIQTSTSSNTYLSKATTRFIPTAEIQDIVIHEAFKGFEVRFYLAVIVEGERNVVVVFPNLLPRRAILEEVWRGSRHCLYDAK
ncbi:hypothetical protein SI65_09690 [Aspergillus cristatus]|uniref:Phosphatidylinositol N-acetylglucosaminyltransferase subunit H conserved domain-containing protein n=1 Tax=Aspergillus cristatus TaxID=573508 RepID=A0A1E3B200_ASPCR|nr:hypothetical protein SI65_09690 [Aspergillus cristatus]